MSYAELLRDPRWQKKRLEVLTIANFSCSRCKCTTRNVQVHHKAYRKNARPWEYENDELEVLCDLCHELEHAILTNEELALEEKIHQATKSMMAADTVHDKRSWFSTVRLLVGQRTPETIRKLELLKGIAK